jgi:hypothetical protein
MNSYKKIDIPDLSIYVDKNFITESYESKNQYEIQLKEVLDDLSTVIGKDIKVYLEDKDMINGLLKGIPKHSNYYHVLNIIYKRFDIPSWFLKKYTEH